MIDSYVANEIADATQKPNHERFAKELSVAAARLAMWDRLVDALASFKWAAEGAKARDECSQGELNAALKVTAELLEQANTLE